jgi:NAD+ kinase
VRLCLDRAGLVGGDGAVHHGFCDTALLRTLPGAVITAAIDEPSSLRAALEFMRTYDESGSPASATRATWSSAALADNPARRSTLGKARCLTPDARCADLKRQDSRSRDPRVRHARPHGSRRRERPQGRDTASRSTTRDSPSPSTPRSSVASSRAGTPILTIEDHSIVGGFGSAVLDSAQEMGLSAAGVTRLGLPDSFIHQDSRSRQLAEAGLDVSQARRFADRGVPLLGVNLGRLGFMAEFDLATLELRAAELFGGGPMTTHELSMLRAEVFGASAVTPRFEGLALNEAAITAGFPFRMIELAMRINGEAGPEMAGGRADRVHADGVPRRTTFRRAVRLWRRGVQALVITPLAVHTLSFRPIVVPADAVVELEARQVNDEVAEGGTTLVLDGQVQSPLRAGDRVRLTGNASRARFVKNPGVGFWQTVIEKLHWAARPRMRRD